MKLEEALKTNKFVNEKHRATLNLIYTSYWLRDSLSKKLKDELGMTVEQHNVLRILKGSHPKQMCVKDIASRLVERSSNVPRIIDRLVTKKLVKRVQSKEDKRETLILLTDLGIEVTATARQLVEQETDRLVNLSEKEAVILNGLMEKMREENEQSNS